ncbi:MAG: pentapeptide repeat-containing protein [Leptolyngbya sp. Prado105]|jgi:uncharacterized protein YjbI with pentapeptide repeats|nr:pentapeptide repeat-containing protein [Leptolyngbya sp. Prado105]
MKSAILAATTFGIALSLMGSAHAEDLSAIQRLLETRSCAGCDLSNANLQGKNLRGVNLRGANLEGANLRGADLSSADLYNTNLRDVILRTANLQNADLGQANLTDADLRDAALGSARLLGAILRGTNIEEARSSQLAEDISAMVRDLTGKRPSQYDLREYVRDLAEGRSRSQIRRNIARSEETKFAIDDLYTSVLGRSADSHGLNTWRKYLERDGRSLGGVRRELIRSAEMREVINRLYREILGREADSAGMQNWIDQLRRGRSLSDIRDRLARSEEARRRR